MVYPQAPGYYFHREVPMATKDRPQLYRRRRTSHDGERLRSHKRIISRVKLLVEWEQAERKEHATPSRGREPLRLFGGGWGRMFPCTSVSADPPGNGPQGGRRGGLAQP